MSSNFYITENSVVRETGEILDNSMPAPLDLCECLSQPCLGKSVFEVATTAMNKSILVKETSINKPIQNTIVVQPEENSENEEWVYL